MTSTNKILAGLLVAQVAVIVGLQLKGDDKLQLKTVTVLEGFDAAKVSSVAILGAPKTGDGPAQESVTLAKENGKWTVAGTDGFEADETKVKELLDALAQLKSRTVVLSGSQYHDKLEVSDAKVQRKVTVKQGNTTTTFYVGSSPSFKNTHLRVDGSDQVLLVNEFGVSQVGSRTWNWVDRKYVDIPADNVWAVRIDNAKGSIQLDKDPATKAWAALAQTGAPDSTTIDDLVRKARTINMETPVGKADKPEYGFAQPLATVTMTTGTSTIAGAPPPTTETVTVKIGKKLSAENQYYVKSSKSDYVVRVAGWAVQPLIDKGPADLVKKEE